MRVEKPQNKQYMSKFKRNTSYEQNKKKPRAINKKARKKR